MGKWGLEMAAALRERGHEVSCLWADDLSTSSMPRAGVLLHPIEVAGRVMAAKPDVAVIHEASASWAVFASMVGGVPVVSMCHNVEAHHWLEMRAAYRRRQASKPPWKAVVTRLWQSEISNRYASAAICLSTFDAAFLASRRDPASVFRMTNGGPAVRVRLRSNSTGERVLTVGGWLDVKGRRLVPDIWRSVSASVPSASLTIVGTGVAREQVLSEFSPECRSRVTVVPREEDPKRMEELYFEHDVLFMPSLSEGCPLALLEAMAAGLPVVATNVGGIPDLVAVGSSAFLFDPAEPHEGAAQLVKAISDPAWRLQASRAAIELAAKRTWAHAAETCEVACREALRAHGGAIRAKRSRSSSNT
jgi:glycosyltransferase involved in cell wall biosynthesis